MSESGGLASYTTAGYTLKNIFSGMDILKNDVIAILSEKINSKLARNGQSSTSPPGSDKQISLPICHTGT